MSEILFHVTSTNVLAFRPGETLQILEICPDKILAYQRVYGVALVSTPQTMPFGGQPVHDVTRPQAVICAEIHPSNASEHEPQVGWVHLGPDEKNIIGGRLKAIKAISDHWYYLVLDTRNSHYLDAKQGGDLS